YIHYKTSTVQFHNPACEKLPITQHGSKSGFMKRPPAVRLISCCANPSWEAFSRMPDTFVAVSVYHWYFSNFCANLYIGLSSGKSRNFTVNRAPLIGPSKKGGSSVGKRIFLFITV